MGSRIELLSKKGLSLAQSLCFSCQLPYLCSKTGWQRVENWPMSNHGLYTEVSHSIWTSVHPNSAQAQPYYQCQPQHVPAYGSRASYPSFSQLLAVSQTCICSQGAAGQPLLISTSSHPHPQPDQAFLQGTCPPASLWWREWWAGCLWWARDVSTTTLCCSRALEEIWTCGISTARPGFTSYCCNSSGMWPWANKVSFPPLSLPAYLSGLIR